MSIASVPCVGCVSTGLARCALCRSQAEAVALRIPLRLLSALRRQQVQALAMDSSSDADDAPSEGSPNAPTANSPAAPPSDDAVEQSASEAPDIAPEAAMAVLSSTSAAVGAM